MNVYITEKFGQAKKLASVIGGTQKHLGDGGSGYFACSTGAVTWCQGHLLELCAPQDYDPKYKFWSLKDLPILPPALKWQPKSAAQAQLKQIKALLSQADTAIIATDYDREGELIGRNVLNYCSFKGKVLRLKLVALDDRSVRQALEHPEPLRATDPLYAQALARAAADWMIGMNFSRWYTCKIKEQGVNELINVGRVLSPTIALVVERDRQIENFEPYEYYQLQVTGTDGVRKFRLNVELPEDSVNLDGRITDLDEAKRLARLLYHSRAEVLSYDKSESQEQPPLPFTQTKLQIYAGREYNFKPSKTMELSQALYDARHAMLTYPRTACEYLPSNLLKEVPAIFENLIAGDTSFAPYVQAANPRLRSRAFDDKACQGFPHHAIIPSLGPQQTAALSADEFAVYDAVRRIFVAQFYPPATYARVSALLECQGIKLTLRRKSMIDPGFKVLFSKDNLSILLNDPDNNEQQPLPEDVDSEEPDEQLPELTSGQLVELCEVKLIAKHTKSPPHFTQYSLISAMLHISRHVKNPASKKVLQRSQGIGTEDTRAAIIEKMIEGGWVRTNGRLLIATPKARQVIAALPPDLRSADTTAKHEQGLESVLRGSVSRQAFVSEIQGWLCQMLTELNQHESEIQHNLAALNHGSTVFACTKCRHTLVKLKGRHGFFWACSNPDCRQTYPDDNGKPLSEPDEDKLPRCPSCEEGALHRYKGKFGFFWKCAHCGQTFNDDAGRPLAKNKFAPAKS